MSRTSVHDVSFSLVIISDVADSNLFDGLVCFPEFNMQWCSRKAKWGAVWVDGGEGASCKIWVLKCVCVCVYCVLFLCASSCQFWFVQNSKRHQSPLWACQLGLNGCKRGILAQLPHTVDDTHTHTRTASPDQQQTHKSAPLFTPLKDKEDNTELFTHIFTPLVTFARRAPNINLFTCCGWFTDDHNITPHESFYPQPSQTPLSPPPTLPPRWLLLTAAGTRRGGKVLRVQAFRRGDGAGKEFSAASTAVCYHWGGGRLWVGVWM